MTTAQAQAFEQYQRHQISSALRSKVSLHGSPSGETRSLGEEDAASVAPRLDASEEAGRTRYTVPRAGRAPVRSIDEAYALMDRLTQRHERGELDDIEYEGRANTLLAEVKALEKSGSP